MDEAVKLFLAFLLGQVLSGPTMALIHQIILHRRRVAADVKVQLLQLNNPPQIPAMPPTPKTDSAVPFLDEDRPIKMKPKTFWGFAAAVAIAATSWGAIKWDLVSTKRDVTDHGEKLKGIETHLTAIETEAVKLRAEVVAATFEQKLASQRVDNLTSAINLKVDTLSSTINLKLDYLTGDKHGPRPTTGTTP